MKTNFKIGLIILFFFTYISNGFAYDWSTVMGKNPKVAGPNCWNLSLVDLGYLPHLRFSSSAEFSQVLDLYCQPVSAQQSLQKGDIVRITTADESDLHAFVFWDAKNGFTKDFGASSVKTNISYRIQPISNIISDYYKNPTSQECLSGLADQEQSPCGAITTFYRCDKNKILLDQERLHKAFSKSMPLLVDLEKSLESYHFGKSTLEQLNLKTKNLNETVKLELFEKTIIGDSFEEKRLFKYRIQGLSEALLGITTVAVHTF